MKEEFENTTPEAMEQQLWEYIDGGVSHKEKTSIEKLIKENAGWRAKYQELLEVHQLIQSTELEQPSMRFAKNVMEEIAKYQITPATKKYINNKIIYGIAAFFITVIAAFLIYGISQIDWRSASGSKSTFGVDLANIDYSKMFNSSFVNIFMMLNIVLGLLLLDRYLTNKRKDYLNSQ